MRIAFIGAGRMAEALIARLRSPQNIIISDVSKERCNFLKKKYKIKIAKNNLESFRSGQVVILAVKPQNVTEVLEEIRVKACLPAGRGQGSSSKKTIISIAAGIPLAYLQRKLPGYPIIRAMPNNPCLVGAGITAISRESAVARRIFDSVGEVIVVPEKWMDAVTGLSGSGPAFVYEVIEALTAGGVAAGLPRKVAAKLALQTVAGAAAVVKETGKPPQELVRMVVSPGGTTVEGLKVLERFRFKHALAKAVVAAAKKSKALTPVPSPSGRGG